MKKFKKGGIVGVDDVLGTLLESQIVEVKEVDEPKRDLKKITLENLAEIDSKLTSFKEEDETLREKIRNIDGFTSESSKILNRRNEIHGYISGLEKDKRDTLNQLIALDNTGGKIVDFTDKEGNQYLNIADFREIDTENIGFDKDTILGDEKPVYIPEINNDDFRMRGYVFDAIRIAYDTYVLAVEKFNVKNPDKTSLIIVTLDQLVLINDYYYTVAEAKNKLEAEEKTKSNERFYDSLSTEKRKRFLDQKGYYHSLPAKIKKTISQKDYEALDLKGKEKIYKPFKRYRGKKLKSKLKSNQMWASFHEMYRLFINKDAWLVDKTGTALPNKHNPISGYSNPETSNYWHAFREVMEWKIKDINAQRKDLSESYQKGMETSFGSSNIDDTLRKNYGIYVKTQRGDLITPHEIDQIEESWSSVKEIIGELKPNAEKHNLKISHASKKHMFASKAIGMYIPRFGTIGVSAKYGVNQFKDTMAHECAHFIDNFIGELQGKRWATDDYESTAGVLAFTFRNMMNKPKSEQTDYINATKECFARAFQMYYAIQSRGEDAKLEHSYEDLGGHIKYVNADHFVSLSNFKEYIKPLIKKFLKENEDTFKTTFDTDQSNDAFVDDEKKSNIKPTVDNSENQFLKDRIEAFKLMLEMEEDESEKEFLESKIDAFEMMLEESTDEPKPVVSDKSYYDQLNEVLLKRKEMGIIQKSDLKQYQNKLKIALDKMDMDAYLSFYPKEMVFAYIVGIIGNYEMNISNEFKYDNGVLSYEPEYVIKQIEYANYNLKNNLCALGLKYPTFESKESLMDLFTQVGGTPKTKVIFQDHAIYPEKKSPIKLWIFKDFIVSKMPYSYNEELSESELEKEAQKLELESGYVGIQSKTPIVINRLVEKILMSGEENYIKDISILVDNLSSSPTLKTLKEKNIEL